MAYNHACMQAYIPTCLSSHTNTHTHCAHHSAHSSAASYIHVCDYVFLSSLLSLSLPLLKEFCSLGTDRLHKHKVAESLVAVDQCGAFPRTACTQLLRNKRSRRQTAFMHLKKIFRMVFRKSSGKSTGRGHPALSATDPIALSTGCFCFCSRPSACSS